MKRHRHARSSARIGRMRVMRISCFALSLLWAWGLGLAACAAGRPNIVLAMADDQGWGDMAYQGHPVLRTPVFDEMARTGLRFDRF